MRYICGNSFNGVVTKPCVIPETLGEAADLERTTISYLCLGAVYQLLDEGKLTIADVQAAYQRGESSS
jgi:hypothetical protein